MSNVKNDLEVESHVSSEGDTVKLKSNLFSISLLHYVNDILFARCKNTWEYVIYIKMGKCNMLLEVDHCVRLRVCVCVYVYTRWKSQQMFFKFKGMGFFFFN